MQGARGGRFTNRAWWHGTSPELVTELCVSLPLESFLMEKEQPLLKIYLGLVCKEDCSLLKFAIHSSAWYLHQVPISICFPHACSAVNLSAREGRNFQAGGCQGSPFNTLQGLQGQAGINNHNV